MTSKTSRLVLAVDSIGRNLIDYYGVDPGMHTYAVVMAACMNEDDIDNRPHIIVNQGIELIGYLLGTKESEWMDDIVKRSPTFQDLMKEVAAIKASGDSLKELNSSKLVS